MTSSLVFRIVKYYVIAFVASGFVIVAVGSFLGAEFWHPFDGSEDNDVVRGLWLWISLTGTTPAFITTEGDKT